MAKQAGGQMDPNTMMLLALGSRLMQAGQPGSTGLGQHMGGMLGDLATISEMARQAKRESRADDLAQRQSDEYKWLSEQREKRELAQQQLAARLASVNTPPNARGESAGPISKAELAKYAIQGGDLSSALRLAQPQTKWRKIGSTTYGDVMENPETGERKFVRTNYQSGFGGLGLGGLGGDPYAAVGTPPEAAADEGPGMLDWLMGKGQEATQGLGGWLGQQAFEAARGGGTHKITPRPSSAAGGEDVPQDVSRPSAAAAPMVSPRSSKVSQVLKEAHELVSKQSPAGAYDRIAWFEKSRGRLGLTPAEESELQRVLESEAAFYERGGVPNVYGTGGGF